MRDLPSPSDIAYALLTRPALNNAPLAAWLARNCFREHQSLYSLCQQYMRDQDGLVFDASEDLYEMNACFTFLCSSPDALETTVEELQDIIFPDLSHDTEEEAQDIQTDFYRVRREERFGLVLRNALRVLQCSFEDVARVYDACIEFKNSEEEDAEGEGDEDAAAGAGSNLDRLETRLSVEQHHAYFDSLAAKRLTLQSLHPGNALVETLRDQGHLHRKAGVMQNAVLELARLHHRVPGQDGEALVAVREAICVAQQNLDQPVLESSLQLLAELTGVPSTREDSGRVAVCRDTLFPPSVATSTRSGSSRSRAQVLWRQVNCIQDDHCAQALLRADAWEQFGSKPLALAWNACLPQDSVLVRCRATMAEFASRGKVDLSQLGNLLQQQPHPQPGPMDVAQVVDTVIAIAHSSAKWRLNSSLARRMDLLSQVCLGKSQEDEEDEEAVAGVNRVEECHALLEQARQFHAERALVLAVRCWALASELCLKTVCSLALVEVARAKMEMSPPASSSSSQDDPAADDVDDDQMIKRVLRSALQHLAAHGTLRDIRHAQLWEIKAQLRRTPSTTTALEHFAKLLEREEDSVGLLEETYYLLARALHNAGPERVRDRDEAARRCLACAAAHKRKSSKARDAGEVAALQTVARAVVALS